SGVDEVERTAAALLAFVRAGHTTRTGDYRRQIRKAVVWLQRTKAPGVGAFLRWRALRELEQAEGATEIFVTPDLEAGVPTTAVERAAIGSDSPRLSGIASLDDVRIAALVVGEVSVPQDLQADGNLVETWMAVGKPAGNLDLKHKI